MQKIATIILEVELPRIPSSQSAQAITPASAAVNIDPKNNGSLAQHFQGLKD